MWTVSFGYLETKLIFWSFKQKKNLLYFIKREIFIYLPLKRNKKKDIKWEKNIIAFIFTLLYLKNKTQFFFARTNFC